jgi:protein TonB
VAPTNDGARQTDARARGQAERRYLSALRHALERERHYPPTARRRRLEGTARVQFTIAADGGFSGIRVSQSAGAASLDEAAASTVRRLARFDPIPNAIGRSRWTVRVPIVFRLN